MNALLRYLDASDPLRVAALAADAGTKSVYLRQVARGYRRASHGLARAIERATDGAVTVHDLRPDIFGPAPGIPPELPKPAAEQEAA